MKKRSILFNGIVVAITSFIVLSLRKYIMPHTQSAMTDQITDSLGLTIVLFGQYLRISARGYKSEKLIEKDFLITDGPYALVRHPMYMASFFIGMGVVILLLHLWVIGVYTVFFLLWYWPQIHNEEQWLIKKFGQAYLDYCRTTPCCFPRLASLWRFNAKQYLPLKTGWIKREWNTILIWSIVVVLAEGYEDISAYTFVDFVREFVMLTMIVCCFVAFAFLFREKS